MIVSCRWPVTFFIASMSTLFRSRARICAFAFLVPNASPRVLRWAIRSSVETSIGRRFLSAFTCLVRT